MTDSLIGNSRIAAHPHSQLALTMRSLVDTQQRAGIAFGVMLRGELVALGACGASDRLKPTPMTPETIVRIFSMSRPITTAAFLTLIDDGVVRLDDPVSDYIPAFAETTVLKSPDGSIPGTEAQVRPITVRMLLTYSSGLSYPANYPPSMGLVQSEIMGAGMTTAEAIDNIARLPLQSQPGARWHYGFSGDVLGHIAEVVSGLPLDRFLQERLLDRIGMSDTSFWVPPGKIDRLSKAYGPKDDDPLADLSDAWQAEYGTFDTPTAMLSAGGGLVSTTVDYLRFLQMLLNGGEIDGERILQSETVRAMLSQHVRLEPGLSYLPEMAFGYGIGVRDDASPRPHGVIGHEATWYGLANTIFFVDTVNEIAAVAMTQYYGPDFEALPSAFREAVYGLIAPATAS